MSFTTATEPSPIENAEDDTVELHVRHVPRSIWLKARQSALASRLRFGQYVIRLLEQAEPVQPGPVPNRQGKQKCSHSGTTLFE